MEPVTQQDIDGYLADIDAATERRRLLGQVEGEPLFEYLKSCEEVIAQATAGGDLYKVASVFLIADEYRKAARKHGAMETLHIKEMCFPQDDLNRWKKSPEFRREFLATLPRRSFVRRILETRAVVRPDRFFGEACVARAQPFDQGWYSSYQWLTARCWADVTPPRGELEGEFHSALKQFRTLPEVQALAHEFADAHGLTPRAPDLWLTSGDTHWFIEAKILPDDEVSCGQLAGLALISYCLAPVTDVRVAVAYLQPEGPRTYPVPTDIKERFRGYFRQVHTLAGQERA
jgi:hypothetical protein